MTRLKLLIWLFLLNLSFFMPVEIQAFERELVIGRKDAWKSFSVFDNIELVDGRFGYKDLVLKDAEYNVSSETDMLIHFNSEEPKDRSGHYLLLKDKNSLLDRTVLSKSYRVFGRASAGFFAERGGLEFLPLRGALFYPGSVWGDFSIEFWFYSATFENDEEIVSWHNTIKIDSGFLNQKVLCRIRDRKVTWIFRNFFLLPEGGKKILSNVTLKGLSGLIPREWSHHLIRFDSSSGMIEYLVNGRIEDVRYTTSNGNDSGDIYVPVTGETADLPVRIGGNFTGFIDEFRISRAVIKKPNLKRFKLKTGIGISGIIDLGYSGTRLKRINAVYEKPADSEIYFYYRLSDKSYESTNLSKDWKNFIPGEDISGEPRGRFLQLRVELFPDGKRNFSPSLSEIHLLYEPDLPPPPPANLYAVPGNGSVTLYWQPVNENDVAGYLVFYGEEPGNYMGQGSEQGNSPIDVGNVDHFKVTGLVNGKLYSFAVVAYDSTVPPHRSIFSKEITARPSEFYK